MVEYIPYKYKVVGSILALPILNLSFKLEKIKTF